MPFILCLTDLQTKYNIHVYNRIVKGGSKKLSKAVEYIIFKVKNKSNSLIKY